MRIGDLVLIRVEVHDVSLLEGIGLLMKKGDPDVEPGKIPIKDGWIVYCEDEFWFIREEYMQRISPRGFGKIRT